MILIVLYVKHMEVTMLVLRVNLLVLKLIVNVLFFSCLQVSAHDFFIYSSI